MTAESTGMPGEEAMRIWMDDIRGKSDMEIAESITQISPDADLALRYSDGNLTRSVAQTLTAVRRLALLPSEKGLEAGEIEEAAQIIYDAFPYDGKGPPEKPAWVPHGNSIQQDAARRCARAVMALQVRITPDSYLAKELLRLSELETVSPYVQARLREAARSLSPAAGEGGEDKSLETS